MFTRFPLTILFLSAFVNIVYSRDCPVKYIGIERGLSNNAVTTMYQDHYGFMWFGTYDGLNRYDGYEFKVFRNIIGDPSSVNSNNINCLEGDWNYNIWVGSQKGLVVYDQRTSSFTPVTYIPFNDKVARDITTNVLKLKAIHKRYMLIATQHAGLLVFDNERNAATQVPYPGSATPTEYHASAIEYPGHGDLVWIFVDGKGLHTYHLKTGAIQLVSGTLKSARCVTQDANNALWMGNDGGLFRYSISSKTYSDNLLPVKTSVRDICVGDGNTLWIASDGTGVWTLPPHATRALPYLSASGEVLIKSNAVYSIYQDQKGRKWVGTLRGGINVIESNGNQFSHISSNRSGSNYNTVEDFILSFCEDESGHLWIGTDGAGIRHWQRDKDIYTEFKHDAHKPAGLGSNFITHIIRDFENDIWVATWFGGVSRFDKKTRSFQRYSMISPITHQKEDNNWIVFEDNRRNLWATAERGLYLYNRSADKFEFFDESLSSIQSMHVDVDGNLWAGTFTSVIRIDRDHKRHVFFNIGYPVRSIHQDKKRNFWVGTQDGGLIRMDHSKGTYKRYSVNDGLPNNTILRILEDDHGNLWLSTYKGLSKFNPSLLTFHNYSESDGLQSNQFSFNAALKLQSGEFAFGGIKGFNIFHPDSIKQHPISPDLFLTRLKINNVPVEKSSFYSSQWSPSQTNSITIPFDSAVLSLDYIALEYSGNDKLDYAYKLEGWDQGWNYVNKTRNANYSKLHEGTYTFKVRVRAPDGTWAGERSLLQISILPPWYRTWWAYSIYAALILVGLYAYVKYARWHERLKYEVKLAHVENEKEREIAEKKLSFFTNISHEFRTPLTLIIDPLKDVISKTNGHAPQKPLEIAYRNARRLLSLVDQLMLFRKADTGHDHLKVSRINMTDLCREVFCCFVENAAVNNISFTFTAPEEPVEVYGDYEKLEIVFFNLLSNAFKFTPENGRISLEVVDNGSQVEVKVQDSGMGIAPEHLETIYEKYKRGTSSSVFSKTGFGIGLYLVKYFVGLHHGKIDCESEVNKGTRFVTLFEKNNPHLSASHVSNEPAKNNELLKEMFVHVESLSDKQEAPILTASSANELLTEKKSILIIDDNEEITHYLQLIFKDIYLLYKASNGTEGFNIVKRYSPDLVISDVHMSGMDGLELCKSIKSSPEFAHIPVILLTGSSAEDTRLTGIEGGADDYITKPFNSELLLARVDNILKNRNLIQNFFFDQITLKPNQTKVPIEYRLFLENCISVIEENLDKEDFNVTTFSRKMGMSHSALYQKIKMISGQSVNNFIRSIRLRRAAVLMLSEDMQVKEAAFQVGLSDVKYFREQFTRLFKMTPSQYIKKYRPSFNHQLNLVKE